jgi:hypothetical protein
MSAPSFPKKQTYRSRLSQIDMGSFIVCVLVDSDQSKSLPFIKNDARTNIFTHRPDKALDGLWLS